MVQSGEIETDKTNLVWPWKVLMTPPVWMSQRMTVLSPLLDTRNVPSNEKARELTIPVWLESADVEIPVITSRIVIFPDLKPTATRSFQHARAHGT